MTPSTAFQKKEKTRERPQRDPEKKSCEDHKAAQRALNGFPKEATGGHTETTFEKWRQRQQLFRNYHERKQQESARVTKRDATGPRFPVTFAAAAAVAAAAIDSVAGWVAALTVDA